MFVRRLNKGKKTYFYVIKAYYDKKKKAPRQKRVADITGLPDQLIEMIREFLKGKKVALVKSEKLSGLKISASRLFGPLWICLHFWMELRVDVVFTGKNEFRRLTGMVLSRVISPCSESRVSGETTLALFFMGWYRIFCNRSRGSKFTVQGFNG